MIKISTLANHLDAMRNETIAMNEASVNAMFEQKDAFDTALDEIRENRKTKEFNPGSPDPVVVNNPSRKEVESYEDDDDDDDDEVTLEDIAAQKLEAEYFHPVGQQPINGGIRYYEANTDITPSQIRYVDVNQSGMSSPSQWTEVDRDDEDMFYLDEKGNRVNIGDLDYEEVGKFLLPRIDKRPTGTVIHKDEQKPDNVEPEQYQVDNKKKQKTSVTPEENSVSIWEPMISMNLPNEAGEQTFQSKKLPTIVTDKEFPKRKFLDTIRTLMNARVEYGKRNGRFTILAKTKAGQEDYKILAITERNMVDKSELNEYLQTHEITPISPEEFMQELRKFL